jgi:hypothetical protein
MTGKEAAQESSAGSSREQVLDFLVKASARDLQEFIHNIPVDIYSHLYQRARTALEIRISEDHLKAAEILERHTRSLISLTRALVWLTFGLLVVTLILAVRH